MVCAKWGVVINDFSGIVFLFFAEPSPEEKLQKLHTDIKFALRVDNPVSRTPRVVSS